MFLLRLCCDVTLKAGEQTTVRIVPVKVKTETTLIECAPPLSCEQGNLMTTMQRKIDHYEGEDLDGKPHGNGAMLYANGDYYRGEWVLGVKEGRGLEISQSNGTKYEGEFHNNFPEGTGKLTNKNQSYYIGEFKNGDKHGKGQYFDMQQHKVFFETYSNGKIKEQCEIPMQRSKDEEFPTLVLDKERFNSNDLQRFERANPQIKEFQLQFLLKYYSLCRIIKLSCISKNVKQWTIKQVLQFLQAVGLKKYQEIFYRNKIKGKDLLTLQESELKNDLKMNLGDRKRFTNYVGYLNSVYEQKSTVSKTKTKTKTRQPNKYSLRSISSLKKSQNKMQGNLLYEQSIQQLNESSQSDSPTGYNPTNLTKDYITEDLNHNTSYHDIHHSLNNNKNSFDDEIDQQTPQSEFSEQSQQSKETNRASTTMKQIIRKKSDEYNPLLLSNSNRNFVVNTLHKLSQGEDDNQKKEQHAQQSSSSTESQLQLTRKKTQANSHNHMEIRELYEFLRQHRSLDFLIKEKDIEILQQIGEGGYGKVYKAKYIGSLIAVKDYMKTGKHRNREDFMKEVQVMSDLKHPNIVLYMGMCITANKYILITEYLENGSLFDQLHKKMKRFTEDEQIEIINDIVKGMVYLHNMKNIIHRDLKSSNVLIGEDWKVKLCDFGLSGQRKKSRKKNKNRVGTYQWMAPEVIRNEEMDFFSDVYSFGVIIWELLLGQVPYAGLTEQQIVGLVGYDETHQLQAPEGTPFLVNIMKKCLKRRPSERPSFMDIQDQFNKYLDHNEENQFSDS